MLRLGLLLLALAGCVLLVVAEFSTLYEIRVITVVKDSQTVGAHHGYAQLVIAIAAAFMAWGALLGGSRPAAYALGVLAVAAVVIALAVDMPVVDEEGFIGEAFEQAEASPKTGFYLETLGAVLLLLGAVATLVLRPVSRPQERPRRRGAAEPTH